MAHGFGTSNVIDVSRELRRIHRKLGQIELLLTQLVQGERIIMALSQEVQDKIDAARAAIAKQTTVEESNRTLLKKLSDMIKDLKDHPGATDPELLAAIDDLANGITKNADDLAADVVANTPAEDGSNPAPTPPSA